MSDAPTLIPSGTPTTLKALQELPLPTPVSWAPQTVGWLAVGLLLAAAVLWGAWRGWRHYRKQRYRRAALAELDRIEANLKDAARRSAALAAIPPLIKRTSLAAAPREHVAALTGDEWLAFLKRTHGHFDTRSGALLAIVSYAQRDRIADISDDESDNLVKVTRDWIRHHHVEI
jgi:Domain of unknown function (DUF4381)